MHACLPFGRDLGVAEVENYCVAWSKDYEAELDAMAIKHGNDRGNWLCWRCHLTTADMRNASDVPATNAVRVAADVAQNPNCTPCQNVAQLDEVLAAFHVHTEQDLRKFVLYDTLHCFYKDGLLDKLVALTFQLVKLGEAGVRRYWLRPWQVELAAERLRDAVRMSPQAAFRRNLMDRRTVAAHAVFVLEGIVYDEGRCPCLDRPAADTSERQHAPTHRHSQSAHLSHLRDVILQYSFEEATERDECDLPFLRTLTQSNVKTAVKLYGPRLFGTYKIHSLLHLYESHSDPQTIKEFTGRTRGRNGAFSLALAHRMPTLTHTAAWKGEQLHRHVKACAGSVFKAGPGNAKEAADQERTLELRIAEKAPPRGEKGGAHDYGK